MTVKTLKKQLAAAIAMVLVSVIALSSSTYAWFAANNQVKATGMNVKAQAEGGLIISNEAKTSWKTSAEASNTALVELAPTNTADASAWYHNVSNDIDNAKSTQDADTYSTLTLKVDNGAGYVDANNNNTLDDGEIKYYLLNKFYIKSSADQLTTSHLYINKVDLTTSTTYTTALDKSVRVAIVIGEHKYIYAPKYTTNQSYKAKNTTSVTAYGVPANGVVNTDNGVTTIPAFGTSEPLEVSVYLYFEGEDANCKTANLADDIDTLSLEVTFGTTTLPTS